MAILEQTFTWAEWLDSFKVKPKDYRPGCHASISSGNDSFTSFVTFDGAVKMAHEGWPEGAERVRDIASRISEVLTSTIEQTNYVHGVVGHNLDVGAYMVGSPECFTSPETIHIDLIGSRLVKVIVSAACNCDRSSSTYERRGAAIVAMIQAMELNGYTCEVWANYDSSDRHLRAQMYLSIKLKNYGDTLDLDRIAFALVHPSHFRRLVFAQMEKVIKKTYGSSHAETAHETGDVYVHRDECVFSTDNDAAEWAERKIADLQGRN